VGTGCGLENVHSHEVAVFNSQHSYLPRLSVRSCGQPQIVAGLFERDSQVPRYPNKKFSPLVIWRWLSVISLFEKLNEFLFGHKSVPRKAGNKILLKTH